MSIKIKNERKTAQFDVLGIGCAAVDDVLYVPSFPEADGKVRVDRHARRFGGLTATALIAAARLGARCAYAGCLGGDELCQSVAENLAREGVDLSLAPRLREARVVHSIIVVARDTGSRNIFYQADGTIGAHPSLPAAEAICASKVLFVDQYGMEGNLRAACIAREAEVPVVGDFEDDTVPCFAEVLELVDHLILSRDFALRLTGKSNAAQAAQALWRPGRAAVVITCGAEGCWSLRDNKGAGPSHQCAFRVETLDTTGCGDVFHGAYAAALAEGQSLDERVRIAAAAAALKAARPEIPRRLEVEELLRENHERTVV